MSSRARWHGSRTCKRRRRIPVKATAAGSSCPENCRGKASNNHGLARLHSLPPFGSFSLTFESETGLATPLEGFVSNGTSASRRVRTSRFSSPQFDRKPHDTHPM